MNSKIGNVIRKIKELGFYPSELDIGNDNSRDPIFLVNGKEVISFNSCNYLGLSNHKLIADEIAKGFKKYGVHPSNSPHMGGRWRVHLEFERKMASFLGFEDCMLFTNTTMANMGVIPAYASVAGFLTFLDLRDPSSSDDLPVIFSDEFNHATIVEGTRLAKAEKVIFKHLDLDNLVEQLQSRRSRRKILVTDGVFSTDGKIAPLLDYLKLKKEFGVEIIVDDAHAMTVLGERGSGSVEHFGLDPSEIDVYITCLSKGFGITGSVVCGKKKIIDFLRLAAKTYVYSRTFLTPMALGGIKAIDLISGSVGKKRRKELWEKVNYVKKGFEEMGLDTMGTQTSMVPIFIGDELWSLEVSKALFDHGIFCPAFRWPAAPKGQARLRFLITYLHKEEHLKKLIFEVRNLLKSV